MVAVFHLADAVVLVKVSDEKIGSVLSLVGLLVRQVLGMKYKRLEIVLLLQAPRCVLACDLAAERRETWPVICRVEPGHMPYKCVTCCDSASVNKCSDVVHLQLVQEVMCLWEQVVCVDKDDSDATAAEGINAAEQVQQDNVPSNQRAGKDWASRAVHCSL